MAEILIFAWAACTAKRMRLHIIDAHGVFVVETTGPGISHQNDHFYRVRAEAGRKVAVLRTSTMSQRVDDRVQCFTGSFRLSTIVAGNSRVAIAQVERHQLILNGLAVAGRKGLVNCHIVDKGHQRQTVIAA